MTNDVLKQIKRNLNGLVGTSMTWTSIVKINGQIHGIIGYHRHLVVGIFGLTVYVTSLTWRASVSMAWLCVSEFLRDWDGFDHDVKVDVAYMLVEFVACLWLSHKLS